MTFDEFQEKYCALCGTQRCTGVYDEDYRDGCQHYRDVYMKEQKTISLSDLKRVLGRDPKVPIITEGFGV